MVARNRLFFLYLTGIIYIVFNPSTDYCVDQKVSPALIDEPELMNTVPSPRFQAPQVVKKVLSNGMTVLVRELHTLPKVAIQLWYNVGSKDEKTGEKGLAHLIEHMIFKGTKKLSESDISMLTHMLSGSTNAFTSYDYTGYLFNLPSHNWQEALPVMADCMVNCTFKEDHLNSEMKAVIQELKMYRDNYKRGLIMDMISAAFPDHPYHYPVIGFKQDLWNAHGDNLKTFYKKHYLPNNATLIVVGDVKAQEVFDLAEKYFGAIEPNNEYQKEQFFYTPDIISRSTILYRDIKQPFVALGYVIPGAQAKQDHILDVLGYVLGDGKGSRLYKKIVDEKHLATSLSLSGFSLFEHGMLLILFEPKDLAQTDHIIDLINKEIQDIVENGLTNTELERAIKKARMDYYNLLEDIEQQAYKIGQYYLATDDENYALNYLSQSPQELEKIIQNLLRSYCRPSVVHRGMVLPLPEDEKASWAQLQKESDQEDNAILAARERTSPIEDPSYAKTLKIKDGQQFNFPKATVAQISNGLKALYYHTINTPKIDLIIELKAKSYFDPEGKQGLSNFVSHMLLEGTKKYTAAQLADELGIRGMSFIAYPGGIAFSMLRDDFAKGLELINEILTSCIFDKKEMEKVRIQLYTAVKNFWDQPKQFVNQIIDEAIYKDHPYAKNDLGSHESIKHINRKDLIDWYKKTITPVGATMAIVGDLNGYDVPAMLENAFSSWQGKAIEPIEFPVIEPVKKEEIDHFINRDQVVLAFAGASIERKNPDFDKLILFDQIFSGGLHSRLYQLREQSGLFYNISGTMVAHTDEQPGMVMVKTIVSLDRLAEAEQVIGDTIKNVAGTIAPEEIDQARHMIVNSLVNLFESNFAIAKAFLWLEKYKFPTDFFDKRGTMLATVTLDDVKKSVNKYLDLDKMIVVKVGRVEKE